jgi:alpha-ketoglutarate-dependent taurine dioxygenase
MTEAKKLPSIQRRAVGSSSADRVGIRPLFPDRSIPTLIEPRVEGLDLVQWAQGNRDLIEKLLWEKRALLFRGFTSGGIPGFEAFVNATGGERLTYKDRSTPRDEYGDRIYNATVYPAEQRINLHNEGTYWIAWALKIYFACAKAATTGGETPIGDVHHVWRRIDPAIRDEFERRQILYVRNYNDGFGLKWQEVFQADSRAEVEEYCARNRIEFEWKDGDRLRTRQKRPAVRVHPRTGEKLWFNHGAFFHYTSLAPSLRDALFAEFGEEGLPYNTFYGDGARIDPQVVEHLLACYNAEKVIFRWQEGDVALYDNMRVAHAREPYTGERLTLVAMTDAYVGPEE